MAFEFAPQPRFGAEAFLVAPTNEHAYAMIMAWPDWPDPALILCGDSGSGKSHLAAIWASKAQAVIAPPSAISAEATLGDFYGRNILVENAETVADARGLFHLINLVQESRASLLLTTCSQPDHWRVTLPDLASRLRRAPLMRIEPPDDSLMRAVIVKLFADRQLAVDAGVVDYIADAMGHSLKAAQALIVALDAEALAQGRRVSKAMAAQIVKQIALGDNEMGDF